MLQPGPRQALFEARRSEVISVEKPRELPLQPFVRLSYFLSHLQSQLSLLNEGQDYAQSFQVLPGDGIGSEEVDDEFPLDEIQLEALLGRVVLLAVLVAWLQLLLRQNLGETILCFSAEALEVLI